MASRQRREAIEVVTRHSADADLEGLTATAGELLDELTQRTRRESIAMRMREHDGGTGFAEHAKGVLQGRPCCGNVTGRAACKPVIEGLGDVVGMTCLHQLSSQMQSGGHPSLRKERRDERPRRQASSGFESIGDGLQTRATQFLNLREVRSERRLVLSGREPDDMQLLPAPTTGHLDAGDESQTDALAGETRFVAAGERVVIGERSELDTLCGHVRHERCRRQNAIGDVAVQVQIGERA